MFAKFKNRINATRFTFSIHVHSLQPWPGTSKAIAIGWQRGKRRRGATNSVLPLPNKEKLGTVVRFNEKFSLTSTLYKAPGADRNSQLGPYKKKCLILAVLETDGRTHATAALGRVVIDLSEFASIDGTELRTFAVACNKSIHAAVGEPQLTLTIKCRWAKAGADMTEDEVASMSTDTTGSNLTTNLRDFFSRGKTTKAARRAEEQDLVGFGRGDGGMATIGEEPVSDEAGDVLLSLHHGQPSAGVDSNSAYHDAHDTDFDSTRGSTDGAAAWAAQDLEYDAVGALNLHDDEDDYDTAGGAGSSKQHSGAGLAPAGEAAALGGAAAAAAAAAGHGRAGRWRMEGVDAQSGRGPTSSSIVPPVMRPVRPTASTHTQTDLADVAPVEPQLDDVTSLQDELLMSAATEAAIHAAQRQLLPGRSPMRVVHAPARRIARTLVCLGRQDGLPFGALALRQLTACVVSQRSEPRQLALWWTNAVHLRGFLQSLNLAVADGTGGGEAPPKHWAAEAFVPRLLQQEKFVFDELVSYVWTHTFVPAVAASRARPTASAAAAGVVKRSGQEAALRKWLGALEAVAAQLRRLGREGHIVTLQHQVLLEVMKRMDTLIFHFLIHPPADGASDASASSSSTPRRQPDGVQGPSPSPAPLHDPLNPNMPMLDDSMLFFSRGLLTFGTGMNLKMACTRFQQWAFGEGGMREIWANLPAQGQALFPLLRASADLLMMPKDLLLEEGIRDDLCESLPLGTLVWMLGHFQPDDFSREGIPYEVLATLRRDAAAAGAGDGSSPPLLQVEGECTYYSPTDDMAMEKVEVGEEPGLEYDADSEDELDALAGLAGDISAGLPPPLRYKLLHNLWAAGVPRSRRITIQRTGSNAGGV